jgi:HlyD family secretion protein
MANWIPKALWGAAAAALIAGGAFWLKGRGAPEVKWRTAPVERGPLQVSVTATGTLQAVVTVQVGTQVSGTVSAIYADFNSQVKKGQVIARIDTTLLRATLADAQSNLEKAAAQARQAEDTRKRTQALFERDLVSQSEIDQATADARVAEANLASAKAQVDRARINLRYATIVSPIDGTVLSRAVDVGQTVAASFNTPTLFTIANDLRQMQVQASVDEADIGKVRVGQRATFTVDAYPDTTFAGEVSQIRLNPVINQNVVSYDVLISVPNPNLRLMPGMTANLSIAVARKEDVLQVPSAALRFSPPDAPRKGRGGWSRPGGEAGGTARTTGAGPGPSGGGPNEAGGAANAAANGSANAAANGTPDAGARARGDSAAGAPAGRGHWAGRDSAGGGTRSWGGRDSARGNAGRDGNGTWAGKRARGMGQVYVLEGAKPQAVEVKTGLSDGSHTEIEGPLAPGTEVIVGMESGKPSGPAAQSSPFGMPRMGGGGRPH